MGRKRKSTKQESVKEWLKETYDLAMKYRPTTLDEFHGNAVLKKSLKHVITNKQIPQAVFLQGPFGSGKTTLARILAKELECSEFDLKEIDIADFTGIDFIRDIRRKAATKPLKGKAKVYILDEVHRLSVQAQDGLLKVLEEPPKHCYFFLCSTDPQSVKNTVKSRCVHYTVQTLSEKQIFELLNHIAKQEEIELPKKVALQISKDSLGHPRNALKIMQKILHLDQDEMLDAAIQEAEKQELAIGLCRALLNGKSWKELSNIIKGIKEEPETVRRIIRGWFTTVLLNGTESAFIVLDVFKEPFYNTDGKNELVRCVYEAYKELND